ncbi:hypothetical protein GGR56DRAFT_500332 [Xylariaceae sp. FL0804]|nr:hypothetical protein GGR56DRAFT_500332 [Xylariaceae sp. FL0804]
MQFTVVILALCTLAMGNLVRVPRGSLHVRGGSVGTQTAAMTDKDGNVLDFDSKNVYMAASAAGL